MRHAGIEGRVALVTGSGQGMGAAIAQRLAVEGARVACNDLNAETAAATAARVGGLALPFDVADRDAVVAAAARVEAELGPLELLVANHAYMTMAPFLQERPEDWRRNLDVNLLGTAWLIEAVAPAMRSRGYGRIVAIASEWGVTGWPEASAYSASKGGIIGLVRSAALALAPHGVAVNGIAPGITNTPQLDVDARAAGVSRAEIVETYARDVPLGRVGEPADIASTVAFLCSTAAEALVGQIVQPNGGTTTAR
jgi:NAD(P)-dependent dehydrogenase (short-subunit alcohol dehydrogenase family)